MYCLSDFSLNTTISARRKGIFAEAQKPKAFRVARITVSHFKSEKRLLVPCDKSIKA